jgi:hypothetical protein
VSELSRRTRGNTWWRARLHVLFVTRRNRSEEEVAQDSTSNAFEEGRRFGVYEIDVIRMAVSTSLVAERRA